VSDLLKEDESESVIYWIFTSNFVGAIILDLDATDISTIATNVVDQLVLTDQLPPECKGQVLNDIT